MTDQRERLGTLIDNHILATGEEYRRFAKRARVSVETLSKARRGEKINARSLARIETALGWEPGTATHILAGGAPPTDTPRVPRNTQHPDENTTPAIRVTGTTPLDPGETLEGWPTDNTQIRYRYRSPHLDARMNFPATYSLEDVVRRFRAMANVGRV